MKPEFVGIIVSIFLIAIGRHCDGQDGKERLGAVEPMVAFLCHHPAMHLTVNGWIPETTTGCLKEPEAILEFCQKVYHPLTIIEVAESAHPMRINGWCNAKSSKLCNSRSYFVKPFRCLSKKVTVQNEKSLATPSLSTFPKSSGITAEAEVAEPEVATDKSPHQEDAYLLFIRNVPESNMTEHEYYTKARNSLRQRHRLKMAKVMEQWERMNQTAERVWNSDRGNAEELHKQITSRFQKLYDALLQEEKYEDRQLTELHQQRIQAEFNRLKRDAMESFMSVIRDDPVDPTSIAKSLKHYIRMEQRDSEHTVSRFLHIRKKDPHEAETIMSYVVEHLKVIDKRIQQAFDMLDRVPKYKKMILRLTEPFLKQFDTLDENIAAVAAVVNNSSTQTSDVSTITDDVIARSISDRRDAQDSSNKTSAGSDFKQEQDREEEKKNLDDRITEQGQKQHSDSYTSVGMTTDTMVTTESTTTQNHVVSATVTGVRKRSDAVHQVKMDHVAFMQKSEHRLKEVDLKDKQQTVRESVSFIATPIGMTLFSIALVLLIAVTLIVLHRRARSSIPATIGGSRPTRNRFLSTRKSSASKKSGVSNGYENPTYRYLNSSAKA